MTQRELDDTATRLEEIALEEELLRSTLQEQVEAFGSTPPRAEKSKRLAGDIYQFTLTRGLTTEIHDAEVECIREVCPAELFEQLFRSVTRFKLADTATLVLAKSLPSYAPRNLRMMFNRAVATKETAPRFRIEKIEVEASTP